MSFPPDSFGPITDRAAATQFCAVCQRRRLSSDEIMTCSLCVGKLDDALVTILELFALLPVFMLPGSVPVADRIKHRQVDAPAPVRLEVVDLMDDRIGDLDDIRRRGIVGVLEQWARLVAQERRMSARPVKPSVATEVGFLRTHLNWVSEQPWVGEFAAEIMGTDPRQPGILRQLEQACGETPPRPKIIGRCPASIIRDGEPQACGTALYADPASPSVQCRKCGAMWDEKRLAILGLVLGEETA